MLVFLCILFSTYLAAVNIYSFLTVLAQEKAFRMHDAPKKYPDSVLYIAGLLGGAVSVYTSMLILRFKTTNLPLMLTMPILSALDIYLTILLFMKGFFLPIG